jgi:MFS family permease
MAAPTSQSNPSAFERHWRIVTVAGLLGMTYYRCCLIGAPQTKFLTELGATEFQFGVIASLGAIAMAFQLVSGAFANRLRRRKPVWMTLFILHRLAFLGVLAAPGLFSSPGARVWWIIAVLLVHNSLIHLGDPLWFSWMSDLVPEQGFSENWGRRQRFITVGGIVAQVGIAFWFGYYEDHGQVIPGFIILGLFGIVLGIIDIFLFSLVPEPPHQREDSLPLRQALAEPFRSREYRPFLVYQIYWQFAVMLAAPFFHVYLIKQLGYSGRTVQLMLVMHGVGMALGSRLWGRVCDSHGFRPVLQFVTICKFIVPLTYVILPPVTAIAIPLFTIMFVFDGFLNAAGGLATKGFALRCTPRRNRAMYVAAAAFVSLGLAGGLAALLAGSVIEPITRLASCHVGPYTFGGYHLVFAMSCLLRLGGFALVSRLHEPDSRSMGEMIDHMRPTGLFGTRSPQR